MATQLTATNASRTLIATMSDHTCKSIAYAPYGEIPVSDSNDQGLPGFNGERVDPLTRATHLGNGYRTYSPALRRFLSPDSESPFGVGGINSYAYCESDPINYLDPSGHGCFTWVARKVTRLLARVGLRSEVSDGLATTAGATASETSIEGVATACTGSKSQWYLQTDAVKHANPWAGLSSGKSHGIDASIVPHPSSSTAGRSGAARRPDRRHQQLTLSTEYATTSGEPSFHKLGYAPKFGPNRQPVVSMRFDRATGKAGYYQGLVDVSNPNTEFLSFTPREWVDHLAKLGIDLRGSGRLEAPLHLVGNGFGRSPFVSELAKHLNRPVYTYGYDLEFDGLDALANRGQAAITAIDSWGRRAPAVPIIHTP